MKATRKQIGAANRIAARFGGWMEPKDFAGIYEALDEAGITVDLITNRRDDFPGGWSGSTTWSLNGEQVENSLFVLNVYEGGRSTMNDYNVYFS